MNGVNCLQATPVGFQGPSVCGGREKCNRRGAEAAETDAELNQFFMSSSTFLGVFLGALGVSAVAFVFPRPPRNSTRNPGLP
jgi:hypothetical protein